MDGPTANGQRDVLYRDFHFGLQDSPLTSTKVFNHLQAAFSLPQSNIAGQSAARNGKRWREVTTCRAIIYGLGQAGLSQRLFQTGCQERDWETAKQAAEAQELLPFRRGGFYRFSG